jgi:hypothetical protein
MAISHFTLSGGPVIGGELKYSVTVPTCDTLYNDIVYFLENSKKYDTDKEFSKRYARIVIGLLALYVESLGNLLLNEFTKKNCPQKLIDYNINTETITKYRDVLYFIFNKKLLRGEMNCIEDLFRIRNELIVHPKAREIIGGSGVKKGKGLSGIGESINYKKLKHFPNILSEFTYEHAQELYNEIKDFLYRYYNRIDKELNNHWIAGYFHLKDIS